VFPVGIGLRDPRSQKRDLGHPSVHPSILQRAQALSFLSRLASASRLFGMTRGEDRYQSTFTPNWTCRAVVAVLLIAPAVPETPVGVNTMRFGVLKFARFSRLKISALNCRLSRS
jgi:hypothetical protein